MTQIVHNKLKIVTKKIATQDQQQASITVEVMDFSSKDI
jgi:hypothetical protein